MTGEQSLTLSSLEHLWGSSPNISLPLRYPTSLVTIPPYEYSFSQAGRLTVTYDTCYPLPLTPTEKTTKCWVLLLPQVRHT